MSLFSSEYHFVTEWLIEAKQEEIYRTLEKVEDLPRWWPSVYLDLRIIEPGQPGGIGKVVELFTKGWLPYTLRWKFRVTASNFPTGFSLEAFGDLEGQGIWTFTPQPDGKTCRVTYDWRIAAEKPLLKYLSFLFKPLFAANHHWAMAKGEQSLKLELQRRNTPDEAIPPPPPPTFPHNLTNNKVFKK